MNIASPSNVAEICITNKTDGTLELFHGQKDEWLQAVRVEPGATRKLRETEADKGMFFVVYDVGTGALRAALAAKCYHRGLILGSNHNFLEMK